MFFGSSKEESFKYFSLAHFAPIVLAAIVIFLIFRFRKKLRDFKYEKTMRFCFAFLMIIAEMSYFWRLLYVGGNIEDHLPITVCGWTCICGAFMLMSENKTLFDITYFWAFGASSNAIITPVVIMHSGPMYFRYYQFWFEHLSLFICVLYMIAVKGYRPDFLALVKAFGAIAAFGGFAIAANYAIGGRANYLFLANVQEEGGSVLDFLPSSVALKALIMGCIVLFLFFLSYLPWLIIDIKNKNVKFRHKQIKV